MAAPDLTVVGGSATQPNLFHTEEALVENIHAASGIIDLVVSHQDLPDMMRPALQAVAKQLVEMSTQVDRLRAALR